MNDEDEVKEILRHGGFAFPSAVKLTRGGTYHCAGITLRDYFAASVSDRAWRTALRQKNESGQYEAIARRAALWAYAYADAMLKERAK